LLVIIDPITSYLGKVDSHKNAELRSVLEPLGKMAAKRHVTVIANTHLSKASTGSANSRVIGSVAFVNHARGAFIVAADPDDPDRRLFIPSKTNLGKPRTGLPTGLPIQSSPTRRAPRFGRLTSSGKMPT
jgi:putative DNA primase/helicase